jgi:hypothetical protein
MVDNSSSSLHALQQEAFLGGYMPSRLLQSSCRYQRSAVHVVALHQVIPVLNIMHSSSYRPQRCKPAACIASHTNQCTVHARCLADSLLVVAAPLFETASSVQPHAGSPIAVRRLPVEPLLWRMLAHKPNSRRCMVTTNPCATGLMQ